MYDGQDIDDAVLIERFRAKDESAFNALYSKYRLPLFAYIHKLLPNACNASIDDYFQQVWIKVVANIERYDERQRFYAWLCRIAKNMIIDAFRRNAGRTYVELDEALKYESDADESAEQDKLEKQLELMNRLIEQLPPEQRSVVEGRRKGLSFKEIAAQQATNLNTILGRMHYAVQKIRDVMLAPSKNGDDHEMQ